MVTECDKTNIADNISGRSEAMSSLKNTVLRNTRAIFQGKVRSKLPSYMKARTDENPTHQKA